MMNILIILLLLSFARCRCLDLAHVCKRLFSFLPIVFDRIFSTIQSFFHCIIGATSTTLPSFCLSSAASSVRSPSPSCVDVDDASGSFNSDDLEDIRLNLKDEEKKQLVLEQSNVSEFHKNLRQGKSVYLADRRISYMFR